MDNSTGGWNTSLFSNSTNSTSAPTSKHLPSTDPDYRSQTTINIQVAILIILGVIIVLGNLASIVTFIKTQSLRRRCHYLIISLSFADLLVGLNVFMVVHFARTGRLYSIFLVLLDIIDTFTGNASILTLAVIAVERFYAIFFPFRHRMLTFSVYVVYILLPWILSASIASLCFIMYFVDNAVYTIYQYAIFVNGFIALLIVIVFYLCIGVKAMQNSLNAQESRNQNLRERKLAVTLLIVTLASFLTWLPHLCLLFAIYLCNTCPLPHINTVIIIKILQYCNSGINLLIYVLRIPEFRKAFLAMLFKKEQPLQQLGTGSEPLSSSRQRNIIFNKKSEENKQESEPQSSLSCDAQSVAAPTLNRTSNPDIETGNCLSKNQEGVNVRSLKQRSIGKMICKRLRENDNADISKVGVCNDVFTFIEETKL